MLSQLFSILQLHLQFLLVPRVGVVFRRVIGGFLAEGTYSYSLRSRATRSPFYDIALRSASMVAVTCALLMPTPHFTRDAAAIQESRIV